MTILKDKEPKDVIAIFVIALVISILVYLAVITAFPKETYYFNVPSINETVRKIDVQLNFQVYVNNELVVDKWNNGFTKNFIKIIYVSLKQDQDTGINRDGQTKYIAKWCWYSENDNMRVELGTTTYNTNVAYDLHKIASSSYKYFDAFPSKSVVVDDNNITITYTWQWTSNSDFTFYEVGIYRFIYPLNSDYGNGDWFLLVYEDIPDGVEVNVDDTVKIVLKIVCEKSSSETFTKKFATEFLDKVFTSYSGQSIEIWATMQYRYIIIGKDCFSIDCASSGEICSTNYIELHHETRTYYTNADKTQCTIELKVTYTPSENVNVKEVCWGFSNTNVGYCKRFDTTLQKDVPYVIKVLITFPTG